MTFSEIFSYFLLVAFTENVVFTRGLGSSKSFRYMKDRKELLLYSGALLGILLQSSLVCFFLSGEISTLHQNTKNIIFPAVSIIVVSIFYFLAAFGVSFIKKETLKNEFLSMIPSSVYSYITVGILMLQGRQNLSLVQCIILSVGSVFGFLIATLLMSFSTPYLESNKILKPFRGTPIKILFIGLMSLAFYGLSGHSLSF